MGIQHGKDIRIRTQPENCQSGHECHGAVRPTEPGSKYAQLKGNFELAYRAMVVEKFWRRL